MDVGTDQARVRVPGVLIEAAREHAGLGAGVSVAAVVRYSLALVANWPEQAARLAAGIRMGSGGDVSE
jgi:hypothetical protein